MKNYNFERVYGPENTEHVEIHSKGHHANWGVKLFCLLAAFVFWLVVTDIRMVEKRNQQELEDKLYHSQADTDTDAGGEAENK